MDKFCNVIFVLLIITGLDSKILAQQKTPPETDPIQLAVNANTTVTHDAKRDYAHAGIVATPLAAALYFYQNLLSEAFQTSCPHYPSCSGFAKDALLHFHLIKALALSADRLSRCTPMGIKDYDNAELNYYLDLIYDPVSDY